MRQLIESANRRFAITAKMKKWNSPAAGLYERHCEIQIDWVFPNPIRQIIEIIPCGPLNFRRLPGIPGTHHTRRSTISFFSSAIALAGESPFGHAFAQFMIVWHR